MRSGSNIAGEAEMRTGCPAGRRIDAPGVPSGRCAHRPKEHRHQRTKNPEPRCKDLMSQGREPASDDRPQGEPLPVNRAHRHAPDHTVTRTHDLHTASAPVPPAAGRPHSHPPLPFPSTHLPFVRKRPPVISGGRFVRRWSGSVYSAPPRCRSVAVAPAIGPPSPKWSVSPSSPMV